jgi:hypothetical protein
MGVRLDSKARFARVPAGMPGPTIHDVALRYVDPEYRHQLKEVTPRARLDVRGARLKSYNLAPAAEPVPPKLEQRARTFLMAQSAGGGLGLDRELGFVILHRCGKAFYFLLVNTWRGSNELWETVLYKENEATEDFALFPSAGPHRAAFCVWELGPVTHEKEAWVKFLKSERSGRDQEHYLEDTFSGMV